MKKVCFVASGGGHLMEIMKLVPATEGHDLYIVTEKNVASEAVRTGKQNCNRFETFGKYFRD